MFWEVIGLVAAYKVANSYNNKYEKQRDLEERIDELEESLTEDNREAVIRELKEIKRALKELK